MAGSKAKRPGTFEQIGGKWRYRIKRQGKVTVGPLRLTKAEAEAAFRQKEQRASQVNAQGGLLLRDQINKDLHTTWARNLSPATLELYRNLLHGTIAKDPLGSIPVLAVTTRDIEQFLEDHAGYSASHLRNAMTLVRGTLNRAGSTIRVPMPKAQTQSEPWCLSPDEQKRLLALPMSEVMRLIVLLGLRAGLRRGEMCGLKHSDRDGEGINVRRTVVITKGLVTVKEPKTPRSRAWVPLHPDLRELVGPPRTGWVLSDGETPMVPDSLYKLFKGELAGTEFARLKVHNLRHTCAMTLLESGVDLITAAEITRHDPAVLAKVYARSRRDLKQGAMDQMSRYLDGAK